MNISATHLAPTLAETAANPKSSGAITSDFETFLKMLTVQLQNQDPLNPIESSEYAVQLATFSSVEQQVRTNDLLLELSQQFQTGGLAQYANWVGKDAQYEGPVPFEGTPLTWQLPQVDGVDMALLIARNEFGKEVTRLSVPATGGSYVWDGFDNNGVPVRHALYSFEVVGLTGGQSVLSEPLRHYGHVEEISFNGGTPLAILAGGVEISAADILGLRESAG